MSEEYDGFKVGDLVFTRGRAEQDNTWVPGRISQLETSSHGRYVNIRLGDQQTVNRALDWDELRVRRPENDAEWARAIAAQLAGEL